MKKIFFTTCMLAGSAPALLASNADNFKEHDPFGWMMAILSMGVVFAALLVLFLCFKYGYTGIVALGLFIKNGFHRKKQLETLTQKRATKSMTVTESATGAEVNDEELAAAIGMALFMHEDGMHDNESDVLTLAPSTSSWTGAGNNQMQMPLRRF